MTELSRFEYSVVALMVGLVVGAIVSLAGYNASMEQDIIRLASFGSALAASLPLIVGAWLK